METNHTWRRARCSSLNVLCVNNAQLNFAQFDFVYLNCTVLHPCNVVRSALNFHGRVFLTCVFTYRGHCCPELPPPLLCAGAQRGQILSQSSAWISRGPVRQPCDGLSRALAAPPQSTTARAKTLSACSTAANIMRRKDASALHYTTMALSNSWNKPAQGATRRVPFM